MVSRFLWLLLLVPSLAIAGSVINSYITFPPAAGGGGSIVVEAVQETGPTSTTGLSLTVPTTTSGELLMVVGMSDDTNGTAQMSHVDGWVQYINNGNNGNKCKVGMWAKWSTSGTAPAFTLKQDNDLEETFVGWYLSVSGVHTPPMDELDAIGASLNSDDTHIAPSITTKTDDALAFFNFCFDGADAEPTTISGTGWSITNEAHGSAVGAMYGNRDMATAGATGDATVGTDVSVPDGSHMMQWALKPEGTQDTALSIAWITDDKTTPDDHEIYIQTVAEIHGHTVTFEDDADAETGGQLDSYDVVWIDRSAVSTEVDGLVTSSKPLMFYEHAYLDTFLFCNGSYTTSTTSEDEVDIVDATHAIAAGYTGVEQILLVTGAVRSINCTGIGSGIDVIAERPSSTEIYIMAAGSGCTMEDSSAAAGPRAYFGPSGYQRSRSTLALEQMFEAANQWAYDDPDTCP